LPAISWSNLTDFTPAPSWRFTCTLPTVAGTNLNGQKLSFQVERISCPMPGINFEPAVFNSGERQFPNLRTIGAITISFIEDTNYSILQYLRAWKNLIIDDDGNYGLPASYKKQIQLQPYDETGQSNITLSWSFCAPSQIEPYDFDGSQTRHVTCSVTFVVDAMDPLQPSGSNTSSGITQPSN